MSSYSTSHHFYLSLCDFFPVALRPNAGQGLFIHEVSRSHTTTHHSRYDSSGRVISPSQIPPPDNTQQSQQTNIHASSGIRTHNLSRRLSADLRLRPRGHWDRLPSVNNIPKCTLLYRPRQLISLSDRKIFKHYNVDHCL